MPNWGRAFGAGLTGLAEVFAAKAAQERQQKLLDEQRAREDALRMEAQSREDTARAQTQSNWQAQFDVQKQQHADMLARQAEQTLAALLPSLPTDRDLPTSVMAGIRPDSPVRAMFGEQKFTAPQTINLGQQEALPGVFGQGVAFTPPQDTVRRLVTPGETRQAASDAREAESFGMEKEQFGWQRDAQAQKAAAQQRVIAAMAAKQEPSPADLQLAFGAGPMDMLTPAQRAAYERSIQPMQPPEVIVDPSSPSGFRYQTRGGSIGQPAPEPYTPGGNRPTLTVGQANQLAQIDTMISALDDIFVTGDKIGWKGIGPMALIEDPMFRYFGEGNPDEATLRSKISKIRGISAHEDFGSAFTQNEKQLMETYIANIYQHPDQAQIHLKNLLDMMKLKKNSLFAAAQTRTGMNPVVNQNQPALTTPPPGAVDIRTLTGGR